MKLFNIWSISEQLAKILKFGLGVGAVLVTLIAAIWWDEMAFVALIPEAALLVASHIAVGLAKNGQDTGES